ncbi:MAG TPA: MIP/aquaporin family protein [Bryobacteraceae bacterium]|nr:MIP/aquaporin family protein [Bryobacteraceae bacterium]
MKTYSLTAEVIAEFLGTLVLVLFGDGVVAMVVLFSHGSPGEVVHGGFTNITLGWGLGVTMGCYIAGKISGAHLNPAVTIAVAVFRDFPWRKVGPYIAAQVAGGFVAAALVYWDYLPAFQAFDPGLDHTAGVFTTFPAFPQVPAAGLLDQVIGTALLVLLILAIIDDRNQAPGANLAPALIGLVVVAIGISFGGMHGYAINPARDFGPRLFTVVAGFRNNGLTDGSGVFWVPIAGPILGGILGAATYDFGVRRFLPASSTQ